MQKVAVGGPNRRLGNLIGRLRGILIFFKTKLNLPGFPNRFLRLNVAKRYLKFRQWQVSLGSCRPQSCSSRAWVFRDNRRLLEQGKKTKQTFSTSFSSVKQLRGVVSTSYSFEVAVESVDFLMSSAFQHRVYEKFKISLFLSFVRSRCGSSIDN